MTQRFLSLKEAEEFTGKSRSSLRRFVEAITKADNHPDRKYLDPSVDRVAELHASNHPFSWRISQELLEREFKKEGSSSTSQSTTDDSTTNKVISLLEETVNMLNTELAQKNKQIEAFQERQRETNILLQQTTEKLVVLTEGNRRKTSASDEAITISPKETEDSTNDSKATSKPKSLWEKLNVKIF
jgi:hypothetical protein